MDAYYSERNANVHRGVYPLAQQADAAYDGARAKVAGFVGWDPKTTIFTKNVTEAINLVAYAWGRANVGPGDAIVTTQMEHHANIVPWQQLCKAQGAQLRYLEVNERGEISLDQLDRELAKGNVKLVAFTHISNVLGTIVPVAEMVARIRAVTEFNKAEFRLFVSLGSPPPLGESANAPLPAAPIATPMLPPLAATRGLATP